MPALQTLCHLRFTENLQKSRCTIVEKRKQGARNTVKKNLVRSAFASVRVRFQQRMLSMLALVWEKEGGFVNDSLGLEGGVAHLEDQQKLEEGHSEVVACLARYATPIGVATEEASSMTRSKTGPEKSVGFLIPKRPLDRRLRAKDGVYSFHTFVF
jgi:hypothetical protein